MKRHTKRIISIVLLVCIFTTCMVGVASARWSHTNYLSAGLSFGDLGKAHCSSYIEMTNFDETATIHMYLQRVVNGVWTNVKSWTLTGSDCFGQSEYYYCTSGYYYRTHVAAYIYDSTGNCVEVSTQNSMEQYY